MKTTPVTSLLSMFLSHLSVTLSSAVTVECNFLKPDCVIVIRLCLSKNCEILECTILSSILDNIGRIEMGK